MVTGGAWGIGRAICLLFAEERARVVVTDVDFEGGLETVSLIQKAGGEAIAIQGDVSRAAEVQKLVQGTIEAFGSLDVFVNNAGIAGEGLARTADYAEAEWDRVIATNLKGVWLGMKYAIPAMLRRGGGSIINMASISGMMVAFRSSCAYGASKAGIIMLTKTAAVEYAAEGVRINALCPGVVDTPYLQRVLADSMQSRQIQPRWLDIIPQGRFASPKEIARAAVFLASDASSYMTGHALVIDGGRTAGLPQTPPVWR